MTPLDKERLVHFMSPGSAVLTACGSCLDEGCGCTPGEVSYRWKNVTCKHCLKKREALQSLNRGEGEK